MSRQAPPLGDSGPDGDLRADLVRLSFHPQFEALARKLCHGNESDAADVLQEARANLLTGTLPQSGTPGGWIRRTVVNTYISKIHRHREARPWDANPGDTATIAENRAAAGPAVEDQVVGLIHSEAVRQLLHRAIAGLSDTLRPVAKLAFDLENGEYLAMSMREIALSQNITEAQVKGRLHEIRKKLREQLTDPGDDEEIA